MTKFTTNHPNGSPCWVDLHIPDLRRAIDFYTAMFGWEVQEGPAESGGYSVCLVGGAPVAAIAPAVDENSSSSFRWNVYFAADDVDAATKLVTDNGGTVVIPATDTGAGRRTIARDPAGAEFGLYQGQAHLGAHIMGEPDTLCWSELNTPDSAASREFYATILGRPVEDMGVPDFDYATVMVDGDGVAGIWGVPGEDADWTVYFAVDDTEAAVARATAAGGGVVREPQDSPYGRFAVMTDPFGARFAVIKLAES